MSSWYSYFSSTINSVCQTACDTYNSVSEYANDAYEFASKTVDQVTEVTSSTIRYVQDVCETGADLISTSLNTGTKFITQTAIQVADLASFQTFKSAYKTFIRDTGFEKLCKTFSSKILKKLNPLDRLSDLLYAGELLYKGYKYCSDKIGLTDLLASGINKLIESDLLSIDFVHGYAKAGETVGKVGQGVQDFIDEYLNICNLAISSVDKIGSVLLDDSTLAKKSDLNKVSKKWGKFTKSLAYR